MAVLGMQKPYKVMLTDCETDCDFFAHLRFEKRHSNPKYASATYDHETP